ncbi:hypothetical protein CU633_07905 [Bacillus sp. V3-13]|uniref:DUF4871 domain-containing protein n=1 Tax=Bacillus sp. V3-13 TaxID=2053728 RepID=UPI000C75A782|nr:DUF4871 domain-containing protein [Bacillus sp. V3-13]PLR77941.1 hypothetical protein CU633_07905 [Bacillus sp. V3-13]
MRLFLLALSCLMLLTACKEQKVAEIQNYELTPTFSVENNTLRGIPDKIGFLNLDFKANELHKVLWHLWGSPDVITGTFRVEGTHIETNEKTKVLLNGSRLKTWELADGYSQGELGANKTKPSYVQFDKPGNWKLEVVINERKFAELIIEVGE